MFGSNFFCFYILHRINVQIGSDRRYPEDFTFLSWLNRILVVMVFFVFMVAYLSRSRPVQRANRPREILLPLFCGLLLPLVWESLTLGESTFVRGSEVATVLFKPLVGTLPGYWSAPSIALMVCGNLISLWAILHLRRSFGILTEVRNLITSGPYRYVRHPLYVGEGIAAVGICYLVPSLFSVAVTIIFLLSQGIRAYWEEQKFLQVTPDYRAFMVVTGAYWPRFRKSVRPG